MADKIAKNWSFELVIKQKPTKGLVGVSEGSYWCLRVVVWILLGVAKKVKK